LLRERVFITRAHQQTRKKEEGNAKERVIQEAFPFILTTFS
jgi:hypothetical protein